MVAEDLALEHEALVHVEHEVLHVDGLEEVLGLVHHEVEDRHAQHFHDLRSHEFFPYGCLVDRAQDLDFVLG